MRILVLWCKLVPGNNPEEFFAVLSVVYNVSPVLPFSLLDFSLKDLGLF